MTSSFSLCPFAPLYVSTPKIQLFRSSIPFSIPRRRPSLDHTPFCCSGTASSAAATSLERMKDKKGKPKGNCGGGMSIIRVRLDHQVSFGESVALVGSSNGLGSWKKEVTMKWTEHGWVCEVQICGGETVEYKFIIMSGDEKKRVVWESEGNRVLKVPDRGGGVYDMVAHWDRTGEVVDLLDPGVGDDDVEKLLREKLLQDGDGDRVEDDGGVVLEGELSPICRNSHTCPTAFEVQPLKFNHRVILNQL